MPTFLFDKIIFGPVKSRRLGVSLGINLLPVTRKICNFNCIYCECGLTMNSTVKGEPLPSRKEVYEALREKLSSMKEKNQDIDVITYAGNGEPTLHPEFTGIIDDSIELRNRYFPEASIAVLSNATTIHKPSVRKALTKVDQNILKLDSALDPTIKIHNQPHGDFHVATLIENLKKFKGNLIVQTMFVRGIYRGRVIDNTTPSEIEAWLEALKSIKPSEVMIYTISRDTPETGQLKKVPFDELNKIADKVRETGIKTQVSG
ncbi:MAG TPA: radical SAM protein [Bacteroidales bacterium]|nr:radical SAM protein [Bacteroidales bacterium]HPR72225.1 radical SAM protein [Bacteroidales bacterium]